MSALGNYIHYYKRNYFSYGINQTAGPRNEGKNLNIEKLVADKRREITNAFQVKEEDKFKKEYQAALNYLYGSMKNLNTKDLEEREKDELKQAFYQMVQKEFPNIIIDYSSLRATGGLEKIGELQKINPNDTALSFGVIKSKLESLSNLFQNEKIKEQYSEKEIQQKYKLFEKVVNTENKLYNQLLQTGVGRKRGYIKMQHPNQTMSFGMNLLNANQEQRAFIRDLNELIAFFNKSSKSNIHGRLGELSAAVAGAKMAGVAAEHLAEFLEKALVGTSASSPTYAKVNFSNEFVDLQKLATTGWKYNDKTGNVMVNRPTQDKVDIRIETEDGLKYLSVKNYNLKKGSAQISLVSGTSLLTMLQDDNQDDFINHYLNITSSRTEEKGTTVNYLSNYRALMHDVMKELILTKALTGLNIQKTMKNGQMGSSVVDYLVVNDNSNPGFFKVFSVSDFLDFSGLDSKQGLAKYATINGYDNPEWKNEGEDAKSRITNLMMQLHQKKLHAFASSRMILNQNA